MGKNRIENWETIEQRIGEGRDNELEKDSIENWGRMG